MFHFFTSTLFHKIICSFYNIFLSFAIPRFLILLQYIQFLQPYTYTHLEVDRFDSSYQHGLLLRSIRNRYTTVESFIKHYPQWSNTYRLSYRPHWHEKGKTVSIKKIKALFYRWFISQYMFIFSQRPINRAVADAEFIACTASFFHSLPKIQLYS